ncbi:MAG: SRPBCC family protein [Chloroflexota bacterium]
MTNIIREVLIKAPRRKVWAKLSDFGNVNRMSPTIAKSYLTSEQTSGINTTRHCDFTMMGASVDERIVGWDEGWCLEIGFDHWDNMPGITSMSAAFTLADEGTDTRICAVMHYEIGMGVVGRMLDAVMVKRTNSQNWESFLAGIRHHIETGEEVSQDTVLDTSDIVAVSLENLKLQHNGEI